MRQAVRELAGTFCLVILAAASARAQPAQNPDADRAARHRWGGRFEAGARFSGRAAALDMFGGVERMIDADPRDGPPRTGRPRGFA